MYYSIIFIFSEMHRLVFSNIMVLMSPTLLKTQEQDDGTRWWNFIQTIHQLLEEPKVLRLSPLRHVQDLCSLLLCPEFVPSQVSHASELDHK